MNIDEAFKENVVYTKQGGQHKYGCKKGNFSTYARDREIAEKEAKHYFWQYYVDGEYNQT